MKFLRYMLMFMLLVVLLPCVLAEIKLSSEMESAYTLGDKLTATFELSESAETMGIFKTTLDCGDTKITYFANTIDFSENQAPTVEVKALKLTDKMTGTCTLKASTESFDGSVLSEYGSDEFTISNKLNLEFSIEKNELLPGEEAVVLVAGTASYGARKFTGTISFNNEEKSFDTVNSMKIKIPSDIKSKSYDVLVTVKDEFGNSAEGTMSINVKQVPTKLGMEIEKSELMPGEKINIKTNILDQAGDEVKDKQIVVNLLNSKNAQIDTKTVSAGENAVFELNLFAEPGEYFVDANYDKLNNNQKVTVLVNKKIQVTFEGGVATITNVGNVMYAEIVSIQMKNKKTNSDYVISDEVSLKVGEVITKDVSVEVPGGEYAVLVESDTSFIPTSITFAENRNMFKRTTDGFSSITGGVIGAGWSSFLIPILLIAIMAVVIFFVYTKKQKRYKQIKL